MLSKRLPAFFLATLVILLSSVFLCPKLTAAQGLEPQIESPLRQNEPVLEQVTQIVTEKKDALTDEETNIVKLQEVKETLQQKLEEAKNDIDTLNEKLAQKKAAAEAERKRVEELKNMFVYVNRNASGSSGNLYAPGNCTWYAKSRRPDLPNNLGNANTWYVRAAAAGFSVGATPKKGAVATSTSGALGHVAYVEGVSLDGQFVTISEMNYRGLYSMNTRTVHFSKFLYIYALD